MAKFNRNEELTQPKRKNTGLDALSLAVKLARENGLTYVQLQHLELHDKAKIKDGKLLFKGRDY